MGTEYTHAKVNLIDSGFIIQTANLTHSSFTKNREHFFQSTDTNLEILMNFMYIYNPSTNFKTFTLL